jgi:hypothetical protein
MKTTMSNAAANLKANKKALAKATEQKVNFDWNTALAMNKAYKAQSLFSVLRFLNEQEEITNVFGTLTIDGLKALCPEYFFQNVRDKKTKEVIQVNRVEFKPFVFIKALRKASPADLKPKAAKKAKKAAK